MKPLHSKLDQNLGWLILAILLGGCVLVMLPFFSALLWAVVLSYSTWPLYSRLLRLLGGRRTLAALLFSMGMFCVVLLPFAVVGATLGDNVDDVTKTVRRWMDEGPPAPPDWLVKLPGVGAKAGEYWRHVAADSSALVEPVKRMIPTVSGWMLSLGIALGRGLFELALSILITFFIFRGAVPRTGESRPTNNRR